MKTAFRTRIRQIGFVATLALSITTGTVRNAQAQPPEPAQNGFWQNMRPEQVPQILENLPPDQQQMIQLMLQNITPAQREQLMQNVPAEQQDQVEQMFEQAQLWLRDTVAAQRWNWVRQTLVASGYTDETLQDAVIDFMQDQEAARQPLRARAQALTTLLVKPDTSTDKLKTELAGFRDTMKKDEARYGQELSALDEKIKFSTQPRLETLLTVLGVVGQETPALGGVGALFPDSPMGNLRGMG